MVGTNLFEWKGEQYLIIIDYYSRYPEIGKLSSTTSSAVITVQKSVFARRGSPAVVHSYNGLQYASKEFSLNSLAVMDSNTSRATQDSYPKSNGQAERTVKTDAETVDRSILGYSQLQSNASPLVQTQPSGVVNGKMS